MIDIDRNDRGFTIVELVVSTAVTMAIMGTIIAMQSTAVDSFEGSIAEERLTRMMRSGASEIRRDIRSLRKDSLVVADESALQSGDPLVTFQQAVDFDPQTGQTNWGADEILGGTVEYHLVGDELIRRIRDSSDVLLPDLDRTLVRHLDTSGYTGPAVEVENAQETNWISFTVRTQLLIHDEPVRREVQTIIHLENVWDF